MVKYTLWDPNLGNVPLITAVDAALAAGSGISIAIDGTTGLVTITAQDQVDDFASPPPLGDVAPNTVAATTLTATGLATLNTTQVGGLTDTQLSHLTALAVTGNSALHTTQVGGLTDTQLSTLAALAVTGQSTLHSTQVGGLTDTQLTHLTAGLTVTGNTTLATTSITGLTATSLANVHTVTVNGVTLVSSQLSGLTSSSLIALTLKTIGGTVGAIPAINSVNLGTSKITVKATVGDTSTYNVAVLG